MIDTEEAQDAFQQYSAQRSYLLGKADLCLYIATPHNVQENSEEHISNDPPDKWQEKLLECKSQRIIKELERFRYEWTAPQNSG